MDEYIDREAAIRMLRGSIVAKYPLSFSSGILASADELEKLSAADVAPVRHGRWVIVDDGVMIGDGKHMECSECHTWKKDRIKTGYCPNCGAPMDLEV